MKPDSPLRVLIDCTQITRDKAGVGVYALNLLREILPLDPTIHYLLLVQSDDPSFLEFAPAPSVRLLPVPSRLFRKLPFRFLLEQLWIPLLTLTHRVDVLHSLHYSFPLLPTRARKLVTIHDMTFLLMPEVHLASKARFFGFFLRAASRLPSTLLFVSQSTLDDFRRLFPQSHIPCRITPLGKSPAFHSNISPVAIEEAVHRCNFPQPYILYIGTLEPRKNLYRLIEAFAPVAARFPHLTLVLAGRMGWMCDDLKALVARLGIGPRILFPGFIAEADKPLLIAGAHVFAYPSLYEGFGIPLLEAMACGVPTLSSRSSSLTEVAGDGALLIDPLSVDQIAAGLTRLIEDQTLRRDLSARAILHTTRFTWGRTARETLLAYYAQIRS